MTGLCTCNKFKIVSPLRSTHVFRWMCEACKSKSRIKKRKEIENFDFKMELLRKVMPTFPAENDNSALVIKRRRG